MRTFSLILTVLTASMMVIAACAPVVPPPVVPPRREMPATARVVCPLTRLNPNPTFADLEAGYHRRGAEVLDCDSMRQLAVDVHDGEHADEDAWLNAPRKVAPR